MSEAAVVVEKIGAVTSIRFDNPKAHNALTRQMWDGLRDASRAVADDPTTRVVVFRGTGGKAFVSGTDISGFTKFTSGADGFAYEENIDACMRAVDEIPVTTIAVVEGWAIGGGLNIACACDFRVATPDARFGSPIGRTIGNCLSASTIARVGSALGVSVAKRMVLLGEIVLADELVRSGFLLRVADRDALEGVVEELCTRAAENAPLTTWATKEIIRRMRQDDLPDVRSIIERVYGSEDFKRGVSDFVAKTKATPVWTGS